MVTINDIRKRLTAAVIKTEASKSVEATKEIIVIRQQEQMLQGLNAKGEKIGRYRNNKYARYKNEINPLPGLGVPDLKLKGGFFSGMQTNVTLETFTTDSVDEKSPQLKAKYGDIFGLTDNSKTEYIQQLRPVFVERMKQKLRL